MRDGLTIAGDAELRRMFRRMPQDAAVNLVRVEKRNLLDHVDEMMRASSFSPAARRNVRRSFVVYPRGRVTPRRIDDVRAGSFTSWKGAGVEDPASPQAAARVLDPRLGRETIRPQRARYLAIPKGPLLTRSGRPKRRGGRRATVRDAERFVRGGRIFVRPSGRNLLVIHETDSAVRRRRRRDGVLVTTGGPRQQLVGVLVPQVRRGARLDWYASWDRLEGRRRDRYRRLLADVIAGRRRD